MAIWVIKDGQREGPYEEQDVRELIYEGTYKDSDPAIRGGQFDWSTLGQLLDRVPAPVEEAAAVAPPSMPEAVEAPTETAVVASTPPALPAVEPAPAAAPPARVAVVDFEMPFGSMVLLMVKWAIAAIPALFILGAIAGIFWTVFFALMSFALRH